MTLDSHSECHGRTLAKKLTLNTFNTVEEPARSKQLSSSSEMETSCEAAPNGRRKKIVFFGHFGWGNFGNESSLQAMLSYLRRLGPDVEFKCICTNPSAVESAYNIKGVPSREAEERRRVLQSPLARLGRKLFVGVPSELYRWFKSFKTLWDGDILIVPGTGLLTDAYTLFNWGPYDMFRWSVAAKLCRCKLMFVSVGAGPIYSRAGRCFVKAALSLADFRSYRDESTLQYLNSIGFSASDDPVYPDLAFSLPEDLVLRSQNSKERRPVVGIGLMEYAWKYSAGKPTSAVYSAYLETLVEFVKWLLDHDYRIRLLIGDLADMRVTREFKSLLKERSVTHEEEGIIDEPIASVADLLRQLAETDVVVATRFHNVLFSLLLNKPVLAVSFHHKCSSLMGQMGLLEYCQDINHLRADRLIEQFCDLERNSERLKPLIKRKTEEFRRDLDQQYNLLIKEMCIRGVTS